MVIKNKNAEIERSELVRMIIMGIGLILVIGIIIYYIFGDDGLSESRVETVSSGIKSILS